MGYEIHEAGKNGLRFKIDSNTNIYNLYDCVVSKLKEFYGSQGISIRFPEINFKNEKNFLNHPEGIKIYKKHGEGIIEPLGIVGVSYVLSPEKTITKEGADYPGSSTFTNELVKPCTKSLTLFFNTYQNHLSKGETADFRAAEKNNFLGYLGKEAKIFGRSMEEKRNMMHDFLLENIVAGNKTIEGNELHATGKKGNKYSINMLTRQSDFPVEFIPDPANFDNDREMLKQVFLQIVNYISEKNSRGIVPGFIFLRAETDYWQLTERVNRIANHGHFLKQKLSDNRNPKPHYDVKTLDPLELSVLQIYKKVVSSGKKFMQNGREYYPELIYFNTKNPNKPVEVIRFSDTKNPSKFKLSECVSCHKPNTPKYDHSGCKDNPHYLNYMLDRKEARYDKHIMIIKKRKHIHPGKENSLRNGVRFDSRELDFDLSGISREFPELTGKKIKIAVVK